MANKSRSLSAVRNNIILNKTRYRSIGYTKKKNFNIDDFNMVNLSNSIIDKGIEDIKHSECLIISEGLCNNAQITAFDGFQFESREAIMGQGFIDNECLILSEGFNNIQLNTPINDITFNSSLDISIFCSCNIYSIDTSDTDDPFLLLSITNDSLASITIDSVQITSIVIKNLHHKAMSNRSKNTSIISNTLTTINIESLEFIRVHKAIRKNKAFSISTKKEDIICNINEGADNIELIHSSKSQIPLFNNADISIISENMDNKVILNDWINYPTVTIMSEDDKPPSGILGNNLNETGNGVKGFKLIVQKNAYVEHALEFNNKTIIDITGLPSGIIFDRSYLKGSPNISGKYNILIKFTDNTALNGIIIVTQIHRRL